MNDKGKFVNAWLSILIGLAAPILILGGSLSLLILVIIYPFAIPFMLSKYGRLLTWKEYACWDNNLKS